MVPILKALLRHRDLGVLSPAIVCEHVKEVLQFPVPLC